MTCLFLYNPASGRGRIGRRLPVICRALLQKFSHVDVVRTHDADDLEARVRDGARRYDAIVFAGGDGTFYRVLQGLEGCDVPVGYLPAGTSNDVARSLGIPRRLRGALRTIVTGCERRVDCLRLNSERSCMYIAAAGAFTRAAYATPQRRKRRLGIWAYAAECLKHEMRFRVFPVRVTCDGRTCSVQAVLAMVLNGRYVAGFPANRRASMADGLTEVAVIRRDAHTAFGRLRAYVSLACLLLFGLRCRRKDILFLRGQRFSFDTEPDVVWSSDGERGPQGALTAEVLPGRLRVFLSARKKI